MFENRTKILAIAYVVCIFALVIRLAYLQIIQHETYTVLSEKNRIRVRFAPPIRGKILDRNEKELTQNKVLYQAYFSKKKEWKEIEPYLQKYSHIFQWNEPIPVPQSTGFTFKNNLSFDDIAFLESHHLDLPAVSIKKIWVRNYSLEEKSPHFLGYTGMSDEKHSLFSYLPSLYVGKSGVEKSYDSLLTGFPGMTVEEVDAFGRNVRNISEKAAEDGKDIHLTIDRRLQDYMQGVLSQERSGSAVVMDMYTGELFGLCSYPTFDPSIFSHSLKKDDWEKLVNDPEKPLLDKSLKGNYAMGSIIKPLVALSALENKIITPETTFVCTGKKRIGDRDFHCWNRYGHGAVNLNQAIRSSCNIYFYELGCKLKPEQLIDTYKQFGFGQKTHVDLPNESAGLLATKEWVQKYRKRNWQRSDTIFLSIGQGVILATPLQLAVMTAGVVNGGYKVEPFLGQREADKVGAKLPVNALYLDMIKQALYDVVNHPSGTGYRHRIDPSKGWKMGGKSGTAQVRKMTEADRKSGNHGADWEWKFRDHSVFAGFADRYVVVVVIDHGGFGSAKAAPIAKQILTFWMDLIKQSPN